MSRDLAAEHAQNMVAQTDARRARQSRRAPRPAPPAPVTVCDLAHEELTETGEVHWSIPDPVSAGDPDSFDTALTRLADRIGRLVPRLTAVS